MRVMQMHCDWCLEPEPLQKWSTLSVGGVSVDLCLPHAQRWETLAGEIAGTSRSGAPGRPSRSPARRAEATDGSSSPAKASRSTARSKRSASVPVDFKAVRAWAQSQGLSVPMRGPVRQEVVDQFLAAPVNASARVEFRHA